MKKPLLLCALLAACSAPEAPEAPTTERPAKRVRVESVEAASLNDVLVLPATIEARESTTLATGRPGRVDGISADTGDRVRKGQAIVRINAASAYAELKQAKAAYDSSKAAFERTEKLLSRKLSTDAAVEVARANFAQTEAALELARANVEYAVLRAPHAGFISARNVAVGEYASPGTALVDIVDIDTVKVVVKVPERDIDAIQLGATAEFQVDALAPETFSGVVERVGVVADRAARTFDVELRAQNPEKRLKPGMLARVRLPRRSLSGVPVVRRDAVVEDLEGPTVFLARNGKAERVRVELGPVEGDKVAIDAGLNVGDPLIVIGQRMLVNGDPVKAVGGGEAEEPSVAKAED